MSKYPTDITLVPTVEVYTRHCTYWVEARGVCLHERTIIHDIVILESGLWILFWHEAKTLISKPYSSLPTLIHRFTNYPVIIEEYLIGEIN